MRMERVAIVRLVKDEDELWLHVKTPDGKPACISLWSIAGPAVRDIVRTWADEHFKVTPAVGRLTEEELDRIYLGLTNNCGQGAFTEAEFEYGRPMGHTVRFAQDGCDPDSKLFADITNGTQDETYEGAAAIAQAGRAIKQLRDERARMLEILKSLDETFQKSRRAVIEAGVMGKRIDFQHLWATYLTWAHVVSKFLKG